jgi:hypothetical protein
MEILRLASLNRDQIRNWGLNGYATDQLFEVTTSSGLDNFTFQLKKIDQHGNLAIADPVL